MVIGKTQFIELLITAATARNETARLVATAMNGEKNIQQIGHLNNALECFQDGVVALQNAQKEGS